MEFIPWKKYCVCGHSVQTHRDWGEGSCRDYMCSCGEFEEDKSATPDEPEEEE